MQDNLKNIELRYQELEARLAANETYADPELVSRLNREQKEALRKFSATLKEHNYKERKSFFEKFKK